MPSIAHDRRGAPPRKRPRTTGTNGRTARDTTVASARRTTHHPAALRQRLAESFPPSTGRFPRPSCNTGPVQRPVPLDAARRAPLPLPQPLKGSWRTSGRREKCTCRRQTAPRRPCGPPRPPLPGKRIESPRPSDFVVPPVYLLSGFTSF